jgi:DNA-binding HxlR family transcriptional regulator
MTRTDEKVGYLLKGQVPPDLAAAGVEEALRVIGGRWKMLILFHLFANETRRFSELERAIPAVSQKMLAQQLRELERDGVVARRVYPEVPPKVEYSLTAMGDALCPALDQLLQWTMQRRNMAPGGGGPP